MTSTSPETTTPKLKEPRAAMKHNTRRNLYQRLLDAQSRCRYVLKGGKVPDEVGGFRYAKHDDVVAACRSRLINCGVLTFSTVTEQSIEYHEREVKYANGNTKTLRQWVAQCVVETHFINVDDPAERHHVVTFGMGIDGQSNAPLKAISGAKKAGLLVGLMLETGEDPERGALLNTDTLSELDPRPVTRPVDSTPAEDLSQRLHMQIKTRFQCDHEEVPAKIREYAESQGIRLNESRPTDEQKQLLIDRLVAQAAAKRVMARLKAWVGAAVDLPQAAQLIAEHLGLQADEHHPLDFDGWNSIDAFISNHSSRPFGEAFDKTSQAAG